MSSTAQIQASSYRVLFSQLQQSARMNPYVWNPRTSRQVSPSTPAWVAEERFRSCEIAPHFNVKGDRLIGEGGEGPSFDYVGLVSTGAERGR